MANYKAFASKSFLVLLSFFVLSCNKEGFIPDEPVMPMPMTGTEELKYQGNFFPTGGINATGSAKIYLSGNGYYVSLGDFSVSSGPDLKVYLGKEYPPANFINLGALKNNTGNQQYTIPAPVDFSVYKYVLIHCQQYNHLFAYAELK
jgi:hypothetical protein